MRHRSFSALLFAGVALAASGSAAAGDIQQTLSGSKLWVRDVVGDVTVQVTPGAQGVNITATGDDRFTSLLTFRQNGERAEIRMGDLSYDSRENLKTLKIKVTVAPGTDIAMENHIGDATIGDTYAAVAVDAVAGRISVGVVSSVSIESAGSAAIDVAEAKGSLSIDTAGSGAVKVGKAGATSISISGSGDAAIGEVSGSLSVDLSGSADVTVASVNGATAISVAGSSDVYIGGGRADPFAASISGSGSVTFGGTAVNPQVSTSGSGEICLASTEGSLQVAGAITIDARTCRRS